MKHAYNVQPFIIRNAAPCVACSDCNATFEPVSKRPPASSPEQAARLLNGLRRLETEHLIVLCLDTKNRVISRFTASQGGLNTTRTAPVDVFRPAIRCGSARIVVAHNHPTGDPAPSADDVEFTRALAKAGHVVGIDVLDHLIIPRGTGPHVSLRESSLF